MQRFLFLGSLTHEIEIEVGEIIQDQIRVRNNGDCQERIEIYQTDYSYNCKGESYYSQPAGQLNRSNATWIEYGPSLLELAAHEEGVIKYTVTVPDDTNMTGTYWSILMLAVLPISDMKPHPKSVQTILRYGIQIVSHIQDTGRRYIQILDTQINKRDEKRILFIDMENTGDRLIRPIVAVEFFNDQGKKMDSFKDQTSRLLPSTSIQHEINLSSIPSGDYKALITIDYGEVDLLGLKCDMVLKD